MIIKSEQRLARTRRGSREALRWSAADAVGRQGISFAVAVVLARLLCPAEFGLVGMLCIFSALASSIVDSGFGSALIQRQSVTETDKSSVFYFNVIIGAAGAVMLIMAASPVARFYRQPLLVPMMRWMALNLFIESLGVVQVALLTRSLDFRSQFKAGFLALLISGAVAVGMAAKGYGVWSLVAQTVMFTTVFTGVVWVLCSWRPKAAFSARSLRTLGSFGSPLLVSGLLNVLFDRMHMAVIGRSFSATQLGYYTRAYSTQQFPSGLLSTIVGRVMLPVFSEMSGNETVLRENVRNALVSMMLIILPMMFGLAVVARPLVLVLFGNQWLPSVPYLQWLCLASACWPIHVINLNVTMAVGRSDLFLRLEIVKKILIAAGIICTFRISVQAMVWATVLVSMLSTLVNSHYSERLIHYGFRKQLRDLAPYIGASLAMVCVGWGVIRSLHAGPLVQLLVTIAACALCYAGWCRWCKRGEMKTLLDLLIHRSAKTDSACIPCTNVIESTEQLTP